MLFGTRDHCYVMPKPGRPKSQIPENPKTRKGRLYAGPRGASLGSEPDWGFAAVKSAPRTLLGRAQKNCSRTTTITMLVVVVVVVVVVGAGHSPILQTQEEFVRLAGSVAFQASFMSCALLGLIGSGSPQ